MTKERKHFSFPRISSNPLKTGDVQKTQQWIEGKKNRFIKFRGSLEDEHNDSESASDQEPDDDL